MNTLIFIAGMGAGSFVAVIAMLLAVGRVNKQSSDRLVKFNEETIRLLSERNELDRQRNDLDIVRNQQLITMEQSVDTASRAIDTWVDNNWKGGRK